MTEKEFVIWLHGFLEISGVKTLDENQLQVVKDHLSTFFVKITPDRNKIAVESNIDLNTLFHHCPSTKKHYC